MGNKESKDGPTQGSSKYAFNEKELAGIKKVYDELIASDPRYFLQNLYIFTQN